MSTINITIKNLSQIKRAFAKSPVVMARELNKAIRKSVVSITKDSKKNTPIDTGRLRSSTYNKFENLRGELGTLTDYDMFVHEGTRFMKARPYLRQAVESNQPEVDRFFEEAVQTTLNEIARQT